MTEHKETANLDQMRILIKRGSHHFVGARHALKILNLIKTDASPKAIEREAKRMPTLAASLVRLASSATFGGIEIKSVHFAIELLGYNELYRLMMTLAMSSMRAPASSRGIFDEETFRRRAVTTAFICEDLAKRFSRPELLGEPDLEKFYMAGLFQDIGYLFLAIHMPFGLIQVRQCLERTPTAGLTKVEEYCLGFNHAELSAVVAEEFQVANDTVQAIRHHHSTLDCPDEHLGFTDIACIAGLVADTMGLPAVPGILRVEVDELACMRLEIDPAEIASFSDGIQQKGQDVAAALCLAA